MTVHNAANYKCPAFGGRCEKHRNDCPEWVHVSGKSPQSDEHIDMYDCARRWVPTLLIEVSQRINQLGGATESLRNELAEGHGLFRGLLARMLKPRGKEPEIKLVGGDG